MTNWKKGQPSGGSAGSAVGAKINISWKYSFHLLSISFLFVSSRPYLLSITVADFLKSPLISFVMRETVLLSPLISTASAALASRKQRLSALIFFVLIP